MAVIDVQLAEESKTRYLTYALSVVHSRALPDVRDGLKPVQRRILYAMNNNLHLTPDKAHRKSAAVVGEVLARYHPHGDAACYEAMVRMAQDFNYRYPLVDGQGNFGSLDGDSAAAYRYTEARLTALALEVLGDIGQETVSERDNFDQTVKEPVVLPSRVPNLLINGSSGIAVGMATAIPPHNLRDVVKALRLLIEDDAVSDTKLINAVQAPDFPTGCELVNSKTELREIYTTGRGAIKMRAGYKLEKAAKGKNSIVISSIPYALDKSVLIEKIADLIISKKIPLIVDIRDESTAEIRIVLELAPSTRVEKDADMAMAYLYKNTPLQSNFNVNLTALIPTANPFVGKPVQLSLRQMLEHFVVFRVQVTRAKLQYEKKKLEERIHLLEGLVRIMDVLDKVIKIVRKSKGRTDAAQKLIAEFKLSELQAYFIVDLRIYQLSQTNIDEVETELNGKLSRVAEINKLLKSEKALKGEVSSDLERISKEYGDDRKSQLIGEVEEIEIKEEEFLQHEDVHVIVTKDGWIKRVRPTTDPAGTRFRDGDGLFFTAETNTKHALAIFTNYGNVFIPKIFDLSYTSGFGDPVQKIYKFKDGEQIVSCMIVEKDSKTDQEIFIFSKGGLGFRLNKSVLTETNKNGKRLARLKDGDEILGVVSVNNAQFLLISEQGYGLCFPKDDVPVLSNAGKGVILIKLPKGDRLVVASSVGLKDKISILVDKGASREINISEMEVGTRAKRGLKIVKRNLPVLGQA